MYKRCETGGKVGWNVLRRNENKYENQKWMIK